MYCRNCGNEVNDKAVACIKCGFNPHSEKNFCPSCGVETNPNQVICTKCGVSLGGQSQSQPNENDKTVAILSYITLIGFIIAVVMHGSNKTKLGAYHLRQALGLMCTGIAVPLALWIVFAILALIMPFLVFLLVFLMPIVSILVLVLLIIGIVNAANGQMKPIPMVGHLYEKWFASLFN